MKKAAFKILSIDGGGIRGVIPCIILRFIEEQTGKKISELFSLIAGTSTGGIIALGLSSPDDDGLNKYDAETMLALYSENGKDIFAGRKKDFLSVISSVHKAPKMLFENPYNSNNMEQLLSKYFGNIKLSEALTDLLITTYDIESGRPFYYSSRLAAKKEKENFLMKEVARSTSAAPTFFTPLLTKYDQTNEVAFVDGGVFANNPSLLAYAEAKELWKQKLKAGKAFDAEVIKDDDDLPFFMLSLGTGFHPHQIAGKDAVKWRSVEWLEPLLSNIFMNSVAASTDYTMQHLLPPYEDDTLRYRRLNFEIPEDNTAMDDSSEKNINALIALAEDYIKNNEKILLGVCEQLS
jgi:uncharacterized protein